MKDKLKRFRTDFLYSTPSVLSAIGSFLSFSGFYYSYNRSRTGGEADNKALLSDWNMIGQDLNDAIIFYQSEIELEKEEKKGITEERQLHLKLD